MFKAGMVSVKLSVVCAILSACSMQPNDVLSTMGVDANSAANPSQEGNSSAVLNPQHANGDTSTIIQDLMERQSVLKSGAFSQVANSVLEANSRTAEAELRAAKLREEAKANNWLPSIGPSISLTSLGDVVTSLVFEQVIYDNGRKKAERDYAAADVDVAAVTLAQDSNTRVLTALELYLDAQKAQSLAGVNQRAMIDMERFEYIMFERVRSGVSGRVDLQIVRQKINQMRSDLASDREASSTALSQLNALSREPLSNISGLSSLGPVSTLKTPLPVLKAQAEAQRVVAEATAARAGFFPSLSLGGSVGSAGKKAGLTAQTDQSLGFGTSASLAAVEQSKQTAQARVSQQREDTERVLRALKGKLTSLRRQEKESQGLAQQADENYSVFSQQQEAGHRAVPDVVSIFETKVRAERLAVGFKYEVARIELKIAAQIGTLVNGEQI